MYRERVTLTGAAETMLATLYGRALDSRSPNPILGDQISDDIVGRVDYDFTKASVTAGMVTAIGLRARQLDNWLAEFLATHPEATVVHLACGLDTRAQRVRSSPSVRWYDVDYPAVIALRRQVLLEPDSRIGAEYQTIGTSVTADDWLETIPNDRPTIVVFEGLSMYLHKEDGQRLIQRITARFPNGQLLFDSCGKAIVRVHKVVPTLRNAGATLHWSIDDPRELESWHDTLQLVDALRMLELLRRNSTSTRARVGMWVFARVPVLRDFSQILRYRF